MRLQPVKASGWITIPLSDEQRKALTSSGAVPVNDVFFEKFGKRNKIRLFYGGYGSGKSVFIAQDLLNKCLNDTYFKCYYGRKVFDTIRGSCFETIIETIEDLSLDDYFKYSKADNSSMIIHCVKNGNKFVPFGADDPDKMKSVKDPSHIWMEEFDQYADTSQNGEREGDFQILFPRLRTIKAQTELIASFNTEAVYETHWILKYFFPDQYEGVDSPGKWFKDIMESMDIDKCFANYTDNYFIDQDGYFKQLQMASGGNELVLRSIANGAWGVTDNKNPWLYNFDQSRHIKDIPFLPTYDVFLSFDFNNDPFACTAWQMSPQKGMKNSFIHCIKEFSGMMKIEEMCHRIKSTFPSSIMHVTGDRSGSNDDIGRNHTLYDMISKQLGINKKYMDLNTHNLEHADSRLLCNALLYNYPNVYIDRKGCPELIRQCQRAKVDVDKNKPSHLLKNRENHKNDEFDSMRYFFQTYFNDYVKKTYLLKKRI